MIHEGPRKGTKNSFARSLFGLSTKGGGEHLFYPRRATKKTFARSLFCLCAKGRGEHFFGLTQIMVVDHENHLRNSPILPAGVLVCHIVSSFLQMSTEPGKHPGQTHLNSDAKIADEGHPQGGGGHPQGGGGHPQGGGGHPQGGGGHPQGGGGHPQGGGGHPQGGGGHPQGVPLPSFFGQETDLQSPKTYGIFDNALRSAQFSALCPGEGTHKGRPYQLFSPGVMP